jgi:hypothetical protein
VLINSEVKLGRIEMQPLRTGGLLKVFAFAVGTLFVLQEMLARFYRQKTNNRELRCAGNGEEAYDGRASDCAWLCGSRLELEGLLRLYSTYIFGAVFICEDAWNPGHIKVAVGALKVDRVRGGAGG